MDAIITWAKENYDLIGLWVGLLGILVTIGSIIYAKWESKEKAKKELKTSIKQKIAEKQAEIDSIKIYYGFDHSGKGNNMAKRIALEKEIEELKKQL